MSPALTGVLFAVSATAIWGLSPLYYKLLTEVGALELLAHRTVWSALIFCGLVGAQGRLRELRAFTRTPRAFGTLLVAAVMISANWGLFIFAVQVGLVTQSSLGYYMMPLVLVAVGVVAFRERLAVTQWIAVGLAALAVLLLTLRMGVLPWLSLTLAVSFALYGTIKKRLDVGPVVSVTGEVLVLSPLALAWLAYVHSQGDGVFLNDAKLSALLVFSGLISALPLILFSAAAKRVNFATLGLLQYLNPSLQLFCAVVVFREPLAPAQAVAFGLIWAGLALYSAHALRQERARRRMSMAAAGESAM
ncbi:EamA family transporter RarD [Salipiger mucosus]|uniref:RarD n=1 Tax=Salipiger mucosus DSM 16094 TaxID=1123237 RepID=S9QP25_9RHOB|nr:EamA family transporter RarD [Salipiger mucosus]EPX81432.1 RarD [Salipiger mucosus DSM 16094]